MRSRGVEDFGVTQPEQYGPYCGLVYKDDDTPRRALTPPHILASAPTRTGKTRRILAPAAVLHPGPAVCVSSKPDLAELILTQRCFGVTGVIDLRPEQTEVWPATVRPMVTDPTATIDKADEALTVAETMLATSGVGFGGASASNASAGGLWESQAAPPLACLLYAASPMGNGLGMTWVLDAVQDFGIPDPSDPQAATNIGGPSWLTAYGLCPHPKLAQPLYAVISGMDARLRDSIKVTVSKAVTPWLRLGLRNDAGLNGVDHHFDINSFDLDMLDEPDATLFVIAPNTGSVAGAAVALIDSIIRRFRRKTANHQLQHRLLLELDEVCNSCPLPDLLTYVGESAGLGVNLMATVQASSHFDVVYSPKYADALREMFPGALIMFGSHERHMLEEASHWLGETTRRTESYEPNNGSRSQSSVFGQMMGWQELLPQNREEAQLLQRGTAGERVHIPDWSEFLVIFEQAIEARRTKRRRRAAI